MNELKTNSTQMITIMICYTNFNSNTFYAELILCFRISQSKKTLTRFSYFTKGDGGARIYQEERK